ncbi:MAG: hypothetical protein RSC76_07305 [Oscillospiraceae bacterium]
MKEEAKAISKLTDEMLEKATGGGRLPMIHPSYVNIVGKTCDLDENGDIGKLFGENQECMSCDANMYLNRGEDVPWGYCMFSK